MPNRIQILCLALPALFLSLIFSPSNLAADELCSKALNRDIDSVEQVPTLPWSTQCYVTEISAAGLLLLEAAIPDAEAPQLRLDFLGQRCGAEPTQQTFHYRERMAHTMLVEVHDPGSYLYCVSAQDPAQALAEHTIRSGFAALRFEKDGNPDEAEPDPDPLRFGPPQTPFNKDGNPDEAEPDPDPLTFGPSCLTVSSSENPRGLEKDGNPDEAEPDPDPFIAQTCHLLDVICSPYRTASHTAPMLCASPIRLGQSLASQTEEFFTFVLQELTTIRITSAQGSSSLYSQSGERILVPRDDSQLNESSSITTLTPGRYYLRSSTEEPGELTLKEVAIPSVTDQG